MFILLLEAHTNENVYSDTWRSIPKQLNIIRNKPVSDIFQEMFGRLEWLHICIPICSFCCLKRTNKNVYPDTYMVLHAQTAQHCSL